MPSASRSRRARQAGVPAVRERRPGRASGRWGELIGRDLAKVDFAGKRRRPWLLLLLGGLLGALCLSALRVDLIRQRYDLASAMNEEKQLLEERRLLTARVRSLRDPARLAALAEDAGFARPDRVVLLDTADVALGPRP